jgi:hypothetical protein
VGQTLSHRPQCPTALLVSTHAAPHWVSVIAHRSVQTPSEQTRLGPQALPHAPQFAGSYAVSVQLAPQALRPL